MKCYRCGGAMVFEKFYGNCEEFFGWRCIFCGEMVDQGDLREPTRKEALIFPSQRIIFVKRAWKGIECER